MIANHSHDLAAARNADHQPASTAGGPNKKAFPYVFDAPDMVAALPNKSDRIARSDVAATQLARLAIIMEPIRPPQHFYVVT